MRNTRTVRANELLARSITGPSFSCTFIDHKKLSKDEMEKEMRKQYRLWASTWVTPLINELVPELKK